MTNPTDNGSLDISRRARDFNWLLSKFVTETAGVTRAVAVSADGFLLAASSGRDQHGIEQLAAIVSGLTSLSIGAAELYDFGDLTQVIIEMRRGYFFVMSINDGSTIGVLADRGSDISAVGYEMALLIDRVGTVLTPALIDELKNVVDSGPRST